MERLYFGINEQTAKMAKSINSFSDYVIGSATQEYKQAVDCVYNVVERIAAQKPDLTEKAINMAERYSRKLAEYYNNYYRNEASCPSIMISGTANFPARKKEKQNSRRQTLMGDWEYLQLYAKKIENLLTMDQPILSSDEKAIERLKEKLENLETEQTMMKKVNAYYRKNKTLDHCPELTFEQIEKLKSDMEASFHYGDKPYMTFELTNNNAKIKNTKLRLENLKKEKESGTKEQGNKFFTIIENKELMRLQLVFDEKPESDVRDILKGNGFRWSPRNNCWQRQLTNNARYSVRRVVKSLEELESLQ